jgi:uncharacterized membrane protein
MMSSLRKYLITGLLVWIPVAATFFIIKLVIDIMDMTILLLPEDLQPENLWGFAIPGLGIILALSVLVLTGALAANLVGRQLVDLWENLLGRIPLVRNIYNAFKQIATTLLASDNKSFRKVVMVKFPSGGLWSIGFLTNGDINISSNQTKSGLVSVFVSTTPNPTTGFLILVEPDRVVELNMTIEEAFKMIMSIGVILPEKEMQAVLQENGVAKTPSGS